MKHTEASPFQRKRPAMDGLSERLVVDRLVGDGKSVKRV